MLVGWSQLVCMLKRCTKAHINTQFSPSTTAHSKHCSNKTNALSPSLTHTHTHVHTCTLMHRDRKREGNKQDINFNKQPFCLFHNRVEIRGKDYSEKVNTKVIFKTKDTTTKNRGYCHAVKRFKELLMRPEKSNSLAYLSLC